jgi:putative membrane protein insertion efficiency factor
MKKTLIFVVNLYQGFVSGFLKNVLGVDRMCRFSPTCSEYAKIQIRREGILRGFGKSAIRLLKCQPFFSF